MDASQHATFKSAPPPSSFNFNQAGVGAGHARARPRPNKVGASGPRESNALRASVFDVAMELGITNNNLVAEWMFNNAVQEEDEVSSNSIQLVTPVAVV
ncbi:hypothetical protein NMY22_g11251 [Coprinellus aureogranulatus]|nr:hypothetical protein NMY22_g11251 [Coprinellus aureogranulatus]